MASERALIDLSILVVDDEPLARQRLATMLDGVGIKAVEQCANGDECLAYAERNSVDIVLLDIEMPGSHGVEVAQHLKSLAFPPIVIFCTAYDDDALQAFDAAAIDYLLKPVALERLEAALQKALSIRRGSEALGGSQALTSSDHLWVSRPSGRERIEVSDIRYLYADSKYVAAVTERGEYLLEGSLKSWEDRLGAEFIRIHRSTVASVDAIIGLEKTTSGQVYVKLRDIDTPLSVSRRHTANVHKRLRSDS